MALRGRPKLREVPLKTIGSRFELVDVERIDNKLRQGETRSEFIRRVVLAALREKKAGGKPANE